MRKAPRPRTIKIKGILYKCLEFSSYARRVYSLDGGLTWDTSPLYALQTAKRPPEAI